MQDKTDGVDPLNPSGLARAGFSGARSMSVDGVPLRAPSQYNMQKVDMSPFVFDGREIVDMIDGERWPVKLSVFNLNKTGLNAINPTMEELGYVDVTTFGGCANFDNGVGCTFCRMGATIGKQPLDPGVLMEQLFALRNVNVYPLRSVCINTGQMPNGDEILYVAASSFITSGMGGGVTVSAEIWPGSVPAFLADLRGVINTFQVNIELASDYARNLLAPAKPNSGAYFAAFERLRKEGFGVSSVLQMNYFLEAEPLKGVLETIGRMLDMGVVPELLPSRAVKGSRVKDGFFGVETTLEQNLARYGQFLDRFWVVGQRFGGQIQSAGEDLAAGCAKCGGCNLNKDLRT